MGQGSKPVYITYLTYKLSYWWGEDEENEYHIESGRYVKLSLRFLWNTKSSSTGRALTDAHVLMSPGPCRFWSLHTSLLSKPSSCHKLALFPWDIDTTGRTLLDIGDIVWAPPLLWTHSYLRVYSLGQFTELWVHTRVSTAPFPLPVTVCSGCHWNMVTLERLCISRSLPVIKCGIQDYCHFARWVNNQYIKLSLFASIKSESRRVDSAQHPMRN